MAIEIKVPQFPESVEEGSIATWHKQVGEAVTRDELVVDIETDKTVLEVVATEDGILTDIQQDGDTVLSQELIGKIESELQPAAQLNPIKCRQRPSLRLRLRPRHRHSWPLTRLLKKLAEENNIDLATLKGTGKGGRILKEDVQKVLAVPKVPDTVPRRQGFSAVTSERVEKRVPMTRLRVTIAKRLLDAQHNAAMLTTFNEVNMGSPDGSS